MSYSQIQPSVSIPDSEIGDALFARCHSLEKLINELSFASDGQHDKMLDRIKKPLKESFASASFIGQVKAGKTSLFNALVGKPGLLPADVNPWTAVVTSMHFGKPGGPEAGADFQFFDDESWRAFAERGGRLAEIAATIPGSGHKMAEIEEEIGRMRNRAELRLGDQFKHLLGKSHQFKEFSTEVLSRYICAGDEPEALVRNAVSGRFADITREANLYFKPERFGFPLRLVDTPGLNDPLLIREEITLQCLEHSDIFVLVLSAHQAFSSADLYLLRILNALRLDRLVVFVNRVDELRNPAEDIPDIHAHIKKMLDQENPRVDIPILFGSALWATQALTGEGSASKEARDFFLDYNDFEEVPKLVSGTFRDSDRAKTWCASGMPVLEKHLDELLTSGVGKTLTRNTLVDLVNANRFASSDAARRIEALEVELNPAKALSATARYEALVRRQSEVTEMETLISKAFAGFRSTVDDKLSHCWDDVKAGLEAEIDKFTDAQVAELEAFYEAQDGKGKVQNWVCDPTPLRRAMNEFFRQLYPLILLDVLEKFDAGAASITEELASNGLKSARDISVNNTLLIDLAPSTAALSRAASFDIGGSWWSGWLNRFKSKDGVSKRLRTMIQSQFRPIVEEILQNVSDKLATTSEEVISNFQTMQRDLLEVYKDQLLFTRGLSSRSPQQVQSDAETMKKRLEFCENFTARLEAIQQEMKS